jgi:hypothetical protein
MRRIRISAGFTALTLLSSCGSSAPPSTTPNEVQAVALSELQQLNARAREGAVTDTLFGTEVADPFRALESESPLSTEWITWQTDRTRTALQSWARQDTATQLEALLRIGTLSGASTYGNQVFFSKRDGTREQPALYVRPLQTRRGQSAEERILIDPLTYGDHAALDWYFPSPTGRFIAFGISQNGDERSTLHIIEVATGRMLDDALEHTKWTDLAWLHSEDGFYYRRYPREGEEAYDAEREDSYNARLFFHRIGEPAASDTLVYAPTDGTFFPSASVSDDDRYVIVNLSRGWSAIAGHAHAAASSLRMQPMRSSRFARGRHSSTTRASTTGSSICSRMKARRATACCEVPSARSSQGTRSQQTRMGFGLSSSQRAKRRSTASSSSATASPCTRLWMCTPACAFF